MSTVAFGRRPLQPTFEKPLPQNLDAERSVLGSILLDQSVPNATLKTIAGQLHAGDFFLPEHQCIFRKMLELSEKQSAIDTLILMDALMSASELDRAGGPGYLAKLTDGVPAISNYAMHAKIVREKAVARQIIYKMNDLQIRAMEEGANNEELINDFNDFSRRTATERKSGIVAVSMAEFLTMKFDPLEFIIEPLLPLRGSGMIYSPPGLGKTHISLYMAFCIAIGAPTCFVWDIPKARRVVYVDGEMDAESLQEMCRQMALGLDLKMPADPDDFRIVTPDIQKGTAPRINTIEARAAIESLLKPGHILFLDNLSTLCPGADEDETENWSKVQEWILDLRRKGIATFIVHHANKSGASQLGTSKKEHQLSVNIRLRRPSNYEQVEGLRVEVVFDKLRSRGAGPFKAQWAQPFEVELRVEDGRAIFLHKPLTKILKERAKQYLVGGMKEHDVVLETGLSRWTVRRIARDIKVEGLGANSSNED
jgi:hypothetical protein